MVTHVNAFTGADLEFPLGWHDFCVDTRDVDTRIQAGAVVRLDQVSCENLAGT